MRGDPESPLRWTCKSTGLAAAGLAGPPRRRGRSRPAARPRLQPAGQPQDPRGEPAPRSRRPVPLHQRARRGRPCAAGQPVISVDTKKKELVGRVQERRPGVAAARASRSGCGCTTSSIPSRARRSPTASTTWRNEGWVSVGMDHDTAGFAVESHPPLVARHGPGSAYPERAQLLITADGGGQQRLPRPRLWKLELPRFADETGPRVTVCHFPPGTSKWNKIEHRLFSLHHAELARPPLVSHEAIVSLIADHHHGPA